jgi:hypothetical protein
MNARGAALGGRLGSHAHGPKKAMRNIGNTTIASTANKTMIPTINSGRRMALREGVWADTPQTRSNAAATDPPPPRQRVASP